jgi:formate hydrogenlyase subunit 4
MNATAMIALLLQLAIAVMGAPFLIGLMRAVRALLEGRGGARIGQPWRDTRKLLRKERFAANGTSWVFAIAPAVVFATAVTVVLLAPFVTTTSPLAAYGDLFAVVSLLLLGTVMLALAGLDTGTAFGGIGASREMTISAVAEPAVLLSVFALALPSGSSNLARITAVTLQDPARLASPASILALIAFVLVTVAETGRLPVDNPSTHLELTMVHEAMVLEYAGPDLAVVEWAAQVRLVVFLGLIATLFFPWGISTGHDLAGVVLGTAVFAAKVAALGSILAAVEVSVAKLRLFRVPELLAGAFLLAFLAVTVSVVLP